MPDVYISRAGVELSELEERFTQTRVEEVHAAMLKDRQKYELKIEALDQKFERLRAEFQALPPVLKKMPAIHAVESALHRRQTS